MSTESTGSPNQKRGNPVRRITTLRLKEMKRQGVKITCLTAYDALTAAIFDECGLELLLVGDSLGNVIQGHETTIPVTLEDIIYHTKAVARGASRAFIVADMPFMSYQVSVEEAFRNAGRLMKEAGADAVKVEGGRRVCSAVERMTEAGIPVMGHLGLTPQSINQFGSYRARGTSTGEAEEIVADAHALQAAGSFAIVLEKIPHELASRVSAELDIPTIGIGAGPGCDGQILVYTDMLGLTTDFQPRFVRHYEQLRSRMSVAVRQYIDDVRQSEFPHLGESY